MEYITKPKIVVLGVGGAGCNAIDNLIKAGVGDGEVKFVSCNTDQQALERGSEETIKLQIGPKTTKGLGAGADPRRGAEAAQESMEEIVSTFSDAHMLFITAGAGGGTGSGAAPEIAKAARKHNILTIGFVVKPFEFEGTMRAKATRESIEKLQESVDCLIIVQNQNLLLANSTNLTVMEGFAKVDEVLCNGVAGIVNIITRHGIVNVDFQDVLRVMKNRMSRVVFGVGKSSGEGAAVKAAEIALSNPLLEVDADILRKVDTALISVTGGMRLSLDTVQQAVQYLRGQINADEDNLIVGITVDKNMKEDEVEVYIFGTCPKAKGSSVEKDPEGLEEVLAGADDFISTTAADSFENQYIGKPHLNLQEEGEHYTINAQEHSTPAKPKKDNSFLANLVKKKKSSWW